MTNMAEFSYVGSSAAVAIAASMFLLWLLSVRLRDASIVDPFWGTGFVVVAWTSAATSWPPSIRGILLLALTTVWGLRLSAYLAWRNVGHGEDPRYQAMRRYWGPRFWWVSLFSVFLLQGVIMWVVSLPVQAVAVAEPSQRFWLDTVGVVVWFVGLTFESVGDWQLAKFKRNPENEGRVLDSGLWALTRHPNYFGDFCIWWGIFLIAAAAGAWWTIVGPVVMSFLLMKVSGVPLLERTIADRRPAYADYVERTNAFFPGLPRKS